MNGLDKDVANGSGPEGEGTGAGAPPDGVNPYATGGGGVTFERKVAVEYLAHMLVGDVVAGLGDDRLVVSVGFQQAPHEPVDDLLIGAARPGEPLPSLHLAIAVRRSPKFVKSDASTRKLILQFVRALIDASTNGPEHRLGLVVSGLQPHVEQIGKLADLAAKQMDAGGFFDLVRTPGKFSAAVRKRLDHLECLVRHALVDLDVGEIDGPLVQKQTWRLISRLTVRIPRLESPDESDWAAVTNVLTRVVPDSSSTTALQLRDRLVALASDYSPNAARVDPTMLRRDTHALLDSSIRRHMQGWQRLNGLHRRACDSVRAEIASGDDGRTLRLDRSAAAADLVTAASSAHSVIVSGESGTGKSAIAVLGLAAAADADPAGLQALCVNLRHIPELVIDFESALGHPLSDLLRELSAPRRLLIVDGADAVVEGRGDVFSYLVAESHESDVKVVAVTSNDSKQVALDIIRERFDTDVAEHVVPPLSDPEIEEIVGTFSELAPLNANPRSREILRRLVVVDLLVRGQVSGTPLTDADAMNEVWSGLVRRGEMSDRGIPDAREAALLKLAELDLCGGDRLAVITVIDPDAVGGLRRDGLLRTPGKNPFVIGPEFAHDEVRRYAVARLLLADGRPDSRLIEAGAPRWSLAAARLACQAWLGQPDAAKIPLRGRLAALQAGFDELGDRHGRRWGDVPGEALLRLENAEALLRDAWPGFLAEDEAGLRRLARLVNQRFRDESGVVDVNAVEPIISIILEDSAPWRPRKHVEGLVRAWLRAHALTGTGAGHPLRQSLRQRLVEACAAGDRRLAEKRDAEAEKRARRPPKEVEEERKAEENNAALLSMIGCGSRRSRRQRDLPLEITDEVLLEFLALLGPDLGGDGEAILGRVAKDGPSWLGPAVDDFFAAHALAQSRRGLLGELTRAYYLDDEGDFAEFGGLDDGIRDHLGGGIGVPHAAWHRGPFMSLFQSDFAGGVRVVNGLLNHAARFRARTLARLDQPGAALVSESAGAYEVQLDVTGVRRVYVGDEHVWRWYRGTGVGPYPCMSALQALERVCDQLIGGGAKIRRLVTMLLDGCESLAMLGLVVGLLVRHLEESEGLLDPYLAEPLIWRLEFTRVVGEANGFAARSDGLVAPVRRNWSFREAAMSMALKASGERVAELRALGDELVLNARRLAEGAHVHQPAQEAAGNDSTEHELVVLARAWASSLDRSKFEFKEMDQAIVVQAAPPDDVTQALQEIHEDAEPTSEATRMFVRYVVDPERGTPKPISNDELVADMVASRNLLENPSSSRIHSPWDICALVAAAALKAHFIDGNGLPDETLSCAAEILLRIGEGESSPRAFEFEGTMFEEGADRSAAQALPLLLLPVAADLRAAIDKEGRGNTEERASDACFNLARAVASEVRLHLARGLDQVWMTPCQDRGQCHHQLGWQIATGTMRHCVLGAWDRETGRRGILSLAEPLTESLAQVADESILVSRLDAAIRALAPAAMANVCISSQARELLVVLLAAQRRSLLSRENRSPDDRGSRTLVSARALLTLARDSEDAAIYEHIEAYADNSGLLYRLLSALSAAAEESPDLAATASRLWPNLVRHVLQLDRSVHTPFRGRPYGDWALGSLLPNVAGATSYLYREVHADPIKWWSPHELKSEVEAWLVPAAGKARCVDQLIGFVQVLETDEQARIGLPWIATLVEADPGRVAGGTYSLATWLIEMRSVADEAGLTVTWQKVVDELVVAGEGRLAPYSV